MEEKKLDSELKKKSIELIDKFIDFSFNLLFTSAMLWLAANIFLKVFNFGVGLRYVQSAAIILLAMTLSWIFGNGGYLNK